MAERSVGPGDSKPAGPLAGTAVFVVLAAVAAGCYPPLPPVGVAPFVGGAAPARARLTASVGVLSALPRARDAGWTRGPVTGGTIAFALGRRYRIAVGGSVLSLGAEGDLVLLKDSRLTVGLLHGVQLAPAADLTGCFLSPCHTVFWPRIAYSLEGGVLVGVHLPRLGVLTVAARAGYAGGLHSVGAAPLVPHEVQGVLTLGWSRRMGGLRVTPQVAVLVVHAGASHGGNVLGDGTTWAIVPTLSISTDL